MRLLGIVKWTHTDKGGHPIAGVQPLYEMERPKWRKIDAVDEYPTQGQVFWWDARDATEGALVHFRAEPNPGQKDEYQVADPRWATEIIDLRVAGGPAEARAALADGLRRPSLSAGKFLIWCRGDLLVGPVRLARTPAGTVTFEHSNHRDKIGTFAAGSPEKIFDGQHERILRTEETPVTGYVDWSDDVAIVKRALQFAVDLGKQNGKGVALTKRQIEDAAAAVVAQPGGSHPQLDRYRLERALSLCENAEYVTRHAQTLADLLREHPSVATALESLRADVRREVEQTARTEIETELKSERAELLQVKSDRESTQALLAADKETLAKSRAEIEKIDDAVTERVQAALDRPAELLAQASVLRPFLAGPSGDGGPGKETAASTRPVLKWTRANARISDRAALQRALKTAAEALGVSSASLLHLHAAVVARLVPVAMGPAALAGLAAYARVACGERIGLLHVSPACLIPDDLLGNTRGDVFRPHPAGLLTAGEAARGVDAPSLLVLEGANRSPIESSLLPLLQLRDAGLPLHSPYVAESVSTPASLNIAVTLVAGAVTVPVTPQLWCHAVALDIQPGPLVPGTVAPTDLAGDLLLPGDVPRETIESLIDAWPDCGEVRIAMERYGAALKRFYSDDARIRSSLLEGIVLPLMVCVMSEENEESVLAALPGDSAEMKATAARLRRRLR